jgi:hypothetical protein
MIGSLVDLLPFIALAGAWFLAIATMLFAYSIFIMGYDWTIRKILNRPWKGM